MTKAQRRNVLAYVRLVRRSVGGLSSQEWNRLRELGALIEVKEVLARSGGVSVVKRRKAVAR